MNSQDQEHAERRAAVALVEAVIAKEDSMSTFWTGLGVAVVLIGAGFFVAAKDLGAMRQAAPPAIAEAERGLGKTERTTPKARSSWSPGALTEADFISRPEFKSAEYQGRLVVGPDGRIKFDTGNSTFALAKYDTVSGRMVPDREGTLNVARFSGDLAYCRSIPGNDMLKCWALDRGIVVDLDQSESVKP